LLKEIQATFWINKFILSRWDKKSITDSDGSTFEDEEELRDFLLKEVK
jgi:hypothetical protein